MEINNVRIYGVEESIVASGYPMRTDLPCEMTKPTKRQYEVAMKLGSAKQGSGNDNFLNGIIIQFDLTCSIKMWQQLQRYHFVDFVSSCSTMHRLSKMDLSNSCYSNYIDKGIIDRMKDMQTQYRENPSKENYLRLLYNNPVGMDMTARLTTNARQLKTIYQQRKNHRLDEWKEFCNWILSLPKEVHPWSEVLDK